MLLYVVKQVIMTSLTKANQFVNSFAYLSVVTMVTCAVLQVYFINRSLQINPSLFHMPIQFVVLSNTHMPAHVCGANFSTHLVYH